MFDFIRTYQLDIMLVLSGICFCFGLMVFITRFLEPTRKYILILMEFVATFLLFFDRLAYIYSGDTSRLGYYMVRISNFFVFFLTAWIVLGFNFYVIYLVCGIGKVRPVPLRLNFVSFAIVVEMLLVIITQFTDLIYYIDETNTYHRAPAFLISYLIPVIGPLVQLTVVVQYRKLINKYVYISMLLYVIVPIVTGIIQIFTYGISIVNMAMVAVSISLYVFTYLDINETVLNAHNHEMTALQNEQLKMKSLFEQTTTSFMNAVEARDEYSNGHATRVATLSKRVAMMLGKSEAECEEIYFAALLHNVGLVSIPDAVLEKRGKLDDDERKMIERVPILSSQILESIEYYPALKEAALYSHEKYDGSGYPVKLSGKSIPEIARIVGAVDDYDAMNRRRSYRAPMASQLAREEFVRQAGIKYDPDVAAAIVRIIDIDNADDDQKQILQVDSEMTFGLYRDNVSVGIPVLQEITKISFDYAKNGNVREEFSQPAIIIFDSFDDLIHDDPKSVEAYHYIEYGEIWFDGHFVNTDARNMKVESMPLSEGELGNEGCQITAAKYEDHVKLEIIGLRKKIEAIIALPDSSKAAYISLTGENCILTNIKVEQKAEMIGEDDLQKIVDKESYIDRMVSDVPNVQVDRYRSDSTAPVEVKDKLQIRFHTMSLPSASLVWHCPYIVLYSSEDGKINSESYHEYAMIKINGEVSGDENITENKFSMKKLDTFPGWEVWKEQHKAGLECAVYFARKGNKVTITTETLGIAIENVTTILDGAKDVYVSISGDQVALTDIRII
ncbi:HD domain-containing protein [Pseudobutyrivibrio sp. YE44]|uniref:HD-GYP domain-containing protein n=1 Tax=Pseudobutyrivibrio sp. YE44 TaxID=1520802 RepID=UPI000891C981|nr:HD domain-containing phosphohydrolase [Pseudobutyrivibrio sp. YE44]SDB50934.1 HD domain-containing protein [Pseudobutyrivibrio sp. YE44]